MFKKSIVVVVLVALMALFVGAVSAQDDTGTPEERERNRIGTTAIRQAIQILSEETGLSGQEILAQLQEGMTLADIIIANGGSVDSVIASAVAAVNERVQQALENGNITQEQADNMLANIEQLITDAVNGDLPLPSVGHRGPSVDALREAAGRNLISAVTEATGLEARDIIQQMRDGSTLAEVITANGGDVDAVVAAAVASATEKINQLVAEGRLTQEQADELIASLESIYTEAVNGSFPGRGDRGDRERPNRDERRLGNGIVQQVAEATGLEARDILQQLRDGSTLADILASAGVDVDGFMDTLLLPAVQRLNAAVADGRLTQEEADARLEQIRSTLLERLNNPANPPMPPEAESSTDS